MKYSYIHKEGVTVLAGHYGFTEDELDFIRNYAIKYRLGRDNDTEEEP